MTNRDVSFKLYNDFTMAERQMLGARAVETVPNMAQSDRVVVEDELLDYLRDFFNGIYDGEPIPEVFSNALIEWKNPHALVRMYVTFPKDKIEWVYIDVFIGWKFIGKMLYPNVKMDDCERNEEGRFMTYTPFLTMQQDFPAGFLEQLIPAVKDIFTYAYLYVQANKDAKEVYKEEEIFKHQDLRGGKKGKKSGGKKKNGGNIKLERDKVYVPTRRIYTVRKTEATERSLCEYVYSRWKVRGYSYRRKDGKIVNVKEHYAFRHLPNKGIDKGGTDFILRKADDIK